MLVEYQQTKTTPRRCYPKVKKKQTKLFVAFPLHLSVFDTIFFHEEKEKNIPKRGYCARKQLISFETHKWNNFGWKFPAQNGKGEDTKQPV